MKVAILTIHHVPNYGAVMQAYSLRNAVIQLGHECDVVNYQPEKAIEFYKGINRKFPKSLLYAIRNRRIQNFVNRFVLCGNKTVLRSSKKVYEHIANYDCVICGSDQIWNADGFRGLDETFFLGDANLPSTKKISYAPSIGSCDPTAYVPNWPVCGEWLKEFDSISVRDAQSQKMVHSFGLPTPQLVCDPTLLPSALMPPSSEKNGHRNCLLIYGAPSLHADRFRELAEKHSLKIISVGSASRLANRNCFFANPREWASLFSSAKIVVTGMFHGVQLAVLNGALPFFVGSAEKKAKVFDSLHRYGLQQQWIEHSDQLSDENVNAGFASMDRVAELRDRISSESLAWLESQLN